MHFHSRMCIWNVIRKMTAILCRPQCANQINPDLDLDLANDVKRFGCGDLLRKGVPVHYGSGYKWVLVAVHFGLMLLELPWFSLWFLDWVVGTSSMSLVIRYIIVTRLWDLRCWSGCHFSWCTISVTEAVSCLLTVGFVHHKSCCPSL